ncbi:hypothetical protein ACFX2J_003967 [Malus domestica]
MTKQDEIRHLDVVVRGDKADEVNELPCCVDAEASDEEKVGLGRVRQLRDLAMQGCCICWIIEGPRCLIETVIPEP